MRNNTKKGFTLVELLVVIAILAILATVSVVGYTSFIEGTAVRVDADLATQLNHFLAAYKVNNNVTIDEDNILDVTADILDLAGVDKLEPQAAQYGYHFYYDFEREEYASIHSGVTIGSGIDITNAAIMNVLGLERQENGNYKTRPGNCFTAEGGRYYLVDTIGDLADLIRGFYKPGEKTTFVQGDFDAFYSAASRVDSTLGIGATFFTDLIKKSVFITAEGNLVYDLAGNHEMVFAHDNVTTITNTKIDRKGNPEIINDNKPLASTSNDLSVTLPGSVVIYGDGLNIEVKDDATVTIKIGANNWEEAKVNLDANFTNSDVVVELGGAKYEVHKNKVYTLGNSEGAYTAVLKYKNPLDKIDVEFKNDATDNEIYNTTTEVVDGENTITVNLGYLGWRTDAPFYLQLDGSVTGVNAGEAISTYEVKWTLGNVVWSTDANDRGAAKKEGKTDADYIKVDPTTGKVTLVAVDGYAPKIDSFEVVATAVVSKNGYPAGEHPDAEATYEYATRTFTVNVVRVTNAALQLANADWNIDIGASFVYEAPTDENPTPNNTCTVGVKVNSNDEKEISYNYEEIISNGDIVLTETFDIIIPEELQNVISLANGVFTAKGAVDNKALTVKIGEYITIDTALTIYDISNFPVQPIHGNIGYLGNLNELTVSELFKVKDNAIVPNGAQIKIYTETGDADYMDWTGKLLYEDVYLKDNSGNWNVDGYEFDWNLAKDFKFDGNSGKQTVHIALFHNGVRISKDIEILVIDAQNVADVSEWVTDKNIVLIDNLKMPESAARGIVYHLGAGKTLYGNYLTFDIKAAIKSGDYGFIRLNENSTMQDLRVVGEVFTKLELTGNNDYGTNAVYALGGSTITNCYIANTRAPLNVNGNVTIHDTVLYGGRYGTADIRGGTLKLTGDVVIVNQLANDVVGTGFNVWYSSNTYSIDIGECDNFTLYNFIEYNDAGYLPPVEITVPDDVPFLGGQTLNLNLATMCKDIFEATEEVATSWKKCTVHNTIHEIGEETDDCCSKSGKHGSLIGGHLFCGFEAATTTTKLKYGEYIFNVDENEDGTVDKRYINVAAFAMNMSGVVFVDAQGNLPVGYTTAEYWYGLFPLYIVTLDPTVEANNTILTNSNNAASFYDPDAYFFVSSDIIH